MTAGKSARSDQRSSTDKANEMAQPDRAPDLDGPGGPQDSEVMQSAVDAIGAPVRGKDSGPEHRAPSHPRAGVITDEIKGVSGQSLNRPAPERPARSAREVEQAQAHPAPGEATARQSNPNAAPTPLQRDREEHHKGS